MEVGRDLFPVFVSTVIKLRPANKIIHLRIYVYTSMSCFVHAHNNPRIVLRRGKYRPLRNFHVAFGTKRFCRQKSAHVPFRRIPPSRKTIIAVYTTLVYGRSAQNSGSPQTMRLRSVDFVTYYKRIYVYT